MEDSEDDDGGSSSDGASEGLGRAGEAASVTRGLELQRSMRGQRSWRKCLSSWCFPESSDVQDREDGPEVPGGGRSETYECKREAASFQDERTAIFVDVPDSGCEETVGAGLPNRIGKGSDRSKRRGKRFVSRE